MKIAGCSELFIEQTTFIGSGFYKPANKSVLNFRIAGGEGVGWTFQWHQQALKAWCEEPAWINWIEEKIPLCALQDCDSAILNLVAQWSLLAVGDELKQAGISIKGAPGQACQVRGWYPVLTLSHGNKKMDLFLADWPAEALRQLVQGWTPLAAPSGGMKPLLRCPLLVGRIVMTYGQLFECVPGAVITLPRDILSAETHYWLKTAEVLIKLVSLEGEYIVSEIVNEQCDDIIDASPELTSLGEINVSVAFEIGTISLSFSQLAMLKPGSVIKPEVTPAASVNIRVNGQVFATGTFIMLEDVPGVRINKLFGA